MRAVSFSGFNALNFTVQYTAEFPSGDTVQPSILPPPHGDVQGAISPAINDLNMVQIPKIYIAVQCIFIIFITAFMNLLTRPIIGLVSRFIIAVIKIMKMHCTAI